MTHLIDNSDTAKKRRVLIVADEPEIVSFLRGVLSELYALAFAPDGKTALEDVRSAADEADVVILDHRLRDMQGLEVLRDLKRLKPRIPVIFITAYGSEDVAVKAFRYGARDYLKKPLKHLQLLDSIECSLSLPRQDKDKPRIVLCSEECLADLDSVKGTGGSITQYNLQRALIFINNNYMQKLSFDSVAKNAYTSKHHLSREFRKHVGCTYREYLNRVRTEKARELLGRANVSITEAAFSAGYSDLRNFERIFKKTQGCTPREYREAQMRNAKPSESPDRAE
jgi:two-component system response regulator YesN